MAMSNITVAGLTPDLKIMGDYQRFHFMDSDHTVKVQAFSEFTPVPLTDSVINLELRNSLLSGFRLSQISTDSDVNPFGSFKFQSFTSDDAGIDIFGFDGSVFDINCPLSMNNNRVINVATPVDGTDAANKDFVESIIGSGTQTLTGAVTGSGPVGGSISTTIVTTLNNLPLATGDLNLNNHRISLLADAVSGTDAVNMNVLDGAIINAPLTLIGDVTASAILGTPGGITTTITSTLDEIPLAAGTVNINSQSLSNVSSIDLSGGIKFGSTTTALTNAIAFPNSAQVRRIALWNDPATQNNFQFSGFGTDSSANILYHSNVSAGHLFYAGLTSSTQTLIANMTANSVIFSKPIYGRRVSGTMYFNSNATTTPIGTINTWTKILGTTTLASSASEFTMPSNNRLQYVSSDPSAPAVTVLITATVTFTWPAAASTVIGFSIHKNGTLVDPASFHNSTAASTFFNVKIQVQTTLNNNDYIELFGYSSATNVTGITASYGSISVQSI